MVFFDEYEELLKKINNSDICELQERNKLWEVWKKSMNGFIEETSSIFLIKKSCFPQKAGCISGFEFK